MKNYVIVGLAVAVVVLGGVLVAKQTQQQVGGDFPGGIVPSQLFQGSVANGFVSPVGSFGFETANGLWNGGSSQYNEQSVYATASGTPASVIALNAFGSATGTAATTSITVPNTAGLAIGDICHGGVATTTAYISGCFLSSTNGATGTAVAAYANGTAGSLSLPTSTVIRISFEHLPY